MTQTDPIAAAEAVRRRQLDNMRPEELVALIMRLTAPLDADARELVAKLRATAWQPYPYVHRNPDGPEAATHIEQQAIQLAAKDEIIAAAYAVEQRSIPKVEALIAERDDARAQLAALTALPEDLAGLCEKLEKRGPFHHWDNPNGPEAVKVIRSQHAELARRDQRDTEVRARIEAARFDIANAKTTRLKDGDYFDGRNAGLDSALDLFNAHLSPPILDTAKPAESRTFAGMPVVVDPALTGNQFRIGPAERSADAVDLQRADRATEDTLDRAWRTVDALGGTYDKTDPAECASAAALNDACLAIEKLGGMDPACRAAERTAANG